MSSINDHIIVIGVGAPAPFTAEQLVAAGNLGHDPRPIWRITQDIEAEWANPWFGAVPYIEAMRDLDKVTDRFGPGGESAKDIVNYFLGNAAQWKGGRSTEIKNELRVLIGRPIAKPRSKKG